ncbi:MAG: mandelate racemase/muconate lactonizing enzyme family protein [Rhodospirillaceae bacterium]
MRITKIEDLHADGGWRTFSFLKVSTDEGLTGWSEFAETWWNPGLTEVIRKTAERAIGLDPCAFAANSANLTSYIALAAGGVGQQAISAIENACIDIAAKAAGVPANRLFGGPVRDRVTVYWSHCGSFRVRNAALFEELLGIEPITKLEDFEALGKEVVAKGYRACKTNPVLFGPDGPKMFNSGFQPGLDHGRNVENAVAAAISDQLAAFRSGLGPDAGLQIDVNLAFRPEALRRVARACEPHNMTWLEADLHAPAELASVRRDTSVPIASLETLYGRRDYLPYFQAQAVDVAVVDVPWNGLAESVRIANLAETFEVNVAPHNFTGPLANMMSAHFCAAVPNVRIMEIEVDDVPWKDDLLTSPTVLEDGQIVVPTGPGWGADINEDAVRAHPVKA